ncbi:MAG: right-handed parallel beta-helix repeat-containing protein [Victivallaceae bacterium]
MCITKMMMSGLAALAAICGLNMNAQDSAANLLKGFSLLDVRGNPQGWFSPLTNPIAIDHGVKPGDGSTSIRVDIRNKSEWGSIQQDISIKKNTAYSFSCQVKGSSPKLVFLMIKLLDAQGKEIKRFKSEDNFDDNWESIQLDFQSGNAEKVSALLRFFQTTDALGESAWFADPRLVIASNATTTQTKNSVKNFSPELSAVPLFAGCGIYIKYGDGDYSKCNLAYRRKGSSKWEDALPPLNVKTDALAKFLPIVDHMFRGSIVNLDENTEYEVKAELLDSNSKLLNTLKSEFKTWSGNVPVKKVVNITKELKAGPVVLTEIHGSPDGWIKYVVDPGTVIDGGAIEEAAVQIKRCSYLLLEGLSVTGGRLYGIDILRSKNIRVVNCDVSGWGRTGRQDFAKKGVYYDANGSEIDFDNGINIYISGNVLVERCYVHDPRGTANSWFYYHPEGAQALGIISTGSTVIRYNDFIGSDEHRWNDAVSGYDNGSKTGGFFRDAEVYGNMLAFGNDDGLEFDGGQMNRRFFKNKVEGFLCGISLAPNMLGPSYVYNNLFVNEGDVTNAAGSVFKNGGGSTYTFGTTFFFNNTAYTNGQGIASVGYGNDKNQGQFNGYSRNNLLACRQLPVYDGTMNPLCDFDYDLMCNQARLDNYYCKAAPGMEKHGVTALPKFKNPENADFNLSAGSRGVGEGVAIPNFAPGTDGRADIGAFEYGKAGILPYRPIPVTCDKGQLNLKVNLKDKTSASDTVNVTVNPGSNWTGGFKIVKNQSFDWVTVEPSAGVFKAGEPVRFTVSTIPAKIKKAGLQKGLFLARMEDGFSIPVTVYATAVSDAPRAVVKVVDAADFTTGNDPKCTSGRYYNFDKASWDAPDKKAVEFAVEIPCAGIYYTFLRVKSPAAPGVEHNSCYIAVDGETPQKIFFENAPCWVWAPVRFPNNKKEPGTALSLTPGKHLIKIYPRKTMLLDTIALSSDPVLE